MILLVGGEKGGTGKSTIATTLAAMAGNRGRDVVLIDADVQGTSTIWAEERTERGHEPRIPCFAKTGRAFRRDVEDLSSRYEDVLIDAGERDSQELRFAMIVCNRMLTPLQPSRVDARKADPRIRSALRGPLRASVVLSRAFTHPNIPETEEAIALLDEYELIGFSGAILRERVAYRRALGLGLAVEEMNSRDESATEETQSLYAYAFRG